MAFTVGSIGDIIAICQLSQSIVKALDDSRGSASEFRQLMRGLSSLAQALQQTQELVKYQNHITNGEIIGSQGLLDALNSSRDCLNNNLDKIRKFQSSLQASGPSKTARDTFWKLRWSGYKTELTRFAQELSTLVGALQISLQIFGIHVNTSQNRALGHQLNNVNINKNARAANFKSKELSDWLLPAPYDSIHSAIKAQRQEGTGRWFIDEIIAPWLLDLTVPPILLCRGIPGAGKSVLMSRAVDHLDSLQSRGEIDGYAYVYFDYRQQGVQTSKSVLCCILGQLALQIPSILSAVGNLHKQLRDSKTTLTMESVLHLMMENTVGLLIVLAFDAMDEALPAVRSELLSLFTKVANASFRILLTGRPDVQSKVLGKRVQTVEIEAREDDLQSFILFNLTANENVLDILDDHDHSLLQQITDVLISHTAGMFLLAVFQIRRVCEQTNAQEMLDIARDMPSDPDSVYVQTLKQIDSQAPAQARLARKVIAWLVLVKRNVTVIELTEGLGIEIGSKSLNTRLLSSESTLLRVCRGLVVINRKSDIGKSDVDKVAAPWLDIDRSNVIGLAHKTFQDFYLKNAADELSQMRKHICLAYITYLGFYDFYRALFYDGNAAEKLFSTHRFLAYATLFLEQHVRESGEPPEVINALFCTFTNPNLAYKLQICYLFQQFAGSNRVFEVLNPTKHFRMRLESGDYSMAPTVLHTGVLIGSSALIQFALDQSKKSSPRADTDGPSHHLSLFDAKDYNERTALHWCALLERPAIARLLIDNGANPNMKDRLDSTPLNDAILNKSIGTMGILLSSKPSTHGQQLLTRAIWAYGGYSYERLEMLNMLIASGINVNAKCRSGSTALHEAAGIGFTAAIEILLANGAVICKDNRGWTPLHSAAAAAIDPVEPVVRIFLDNGVDINARAENGMTALHVAALNCNAKVAKALIIYGALIDAKDGQGRTAIQLVVAMGIPEDYFALSYMVRLLRDCGATPPGMIDDLDTDERSYFASGVHCDHCEMKIRTSDVFFTCSLCDNGDFNLCQSCVNEGRWCDNSEHIMEKTYTRVVDTGPSGVECNYCGFEFTTGYRFFHCCSCDNGEFDLCQSCKENGHHCNDVEHALENRFLATIDPFAAECELCGLEFGISDSLFHCTVCNLGLCQSCAQKRQHCSCFTNGLERKILKIKGFKRGSYPIPGYKMGFLNKYGICYTEQTSLLNVAMAEEHIEQDMAAPPNNSGKRAWNEQEEILPHRLKHPRQEQDSSV